MIFDLDGTLVNAYPAVVSSVNFTLQKLGFPKKTAYQIKRAVGWGDKQLVVQFVGEELAGEALQLYRQHHLKALETGVRFLPGSRALLKWCRAQGLMLAIASNRPLMFTKVILQGLGVEEMFDQVLCGDQVKKAKPYPDMLLSICRKCKIKKSETLFVGDMTIDLNCGARAGIRTVGVATGSNTKKELLELKPYKIIDSINQLKTLIPLA
ncbi:MAG: HAD family hydrolase [Candidatus Omnitrophica bacterium]|nr:HAD family hydrolase [Candidatus Omnitrophota bacterium]